MPEADGTAFKNSFSEALKRLQAIEGKYALSAVRQGLDACAALLDGQNTIDVGIFGRFKAGKSSLLNLLSNRPVLPVGVTPVTTVVTRLHYGPFERAEIDLQRPSSPDVAISNLFMFNTDLLWFVIPMRIFRSWAGRHLLKRPFTAEAQNKRRRDADSFDALCGDFNLWMAVFVGVLALSLVFMPRAIRAVIGRYSARHVSEPEVKTISPTSPTISIPTM